MRKLITLSGIIAILAVIWVGALIFLDLSIDKLKDTLKKDYNATMLCTYDTHTEGTISYEFECDQMYQGKNITEYYKSNMLIAYVRDGIFYYDSDLDKSYDIIINSNYALCKVQ